MTDIFTVGAFRLNKGTSYSGNVKLRSVPVNGRLVTLFWFPDKNIIVSNRNQPFDIRDDGNQINQRLRQAWCQLSGVKYKDLMAEVDKQRRADHQERFEDMICDLHSEVHQLEALAVDECLQPKHGQRLSEIHSVIGRLVRRSSPG